MKKVTGDTLYIALNINTLYIHKLFLFILINNSDQSGNSWKFYLPLLPV